jgi:CubicO group peptidase (beta-lactamase class C family)
LFVSVEEQKMRVERLAYSPYVFVAIGLAVILIVGWAILSEAGVQKPPSGQAKAPAETRLCEILAAVESGDEGRMEAVAGAFARPFLDKIPVPEHVAFFRRIHDQYGGFEIAFIKLESPYAVEAQVESKNSGEMVRIALTVEPDPPHAVNGIDIGEVKPPELPEALREGASAKDPAAVVNGTVGEAIDTFMTAAQKSGFSGCVIVAKGPDIVIKKGYGWANYAKKYPVTSTTVFDIGSITKPFTATAILVLEQRGKLSVFDPIGKYFDNVPPDKAGITVHHLLTHTSGLLEYHDTKGDFEEMTRDEAIRRILAQKLKFKPGEGNDYSNSGYTLLAAVIEKVSVLSYQEFLKSAIFDPAGMSSAGFYRDQSWTEKDIAVGYGDRELGEVNSPLAWPKIGWALIGNGGLVMSAEDLYKFHLALQGEEILSAAAKEKAFTPHWELRPSVGEGYGWVVALTEAKKRVVRHGGANDFGFRAAFSRALDDDTVIIILSNAGQFAKLRDYLAKIERLAS